METDHGVSGAAASGDWQAVVVSVAEEYAGWPVVSLIHDALRERCQQRHLSIDDDILNRAAVALSQQG